MRIPKKLIAFVLLILVLGFGIAIYFYFRLNESVVKSDFYLFIPKGSDAEDVFQLLSEKEEIAPYELIPLIGEKKNYKGSLVVSGKYKISKGMSAPELIDHLRAGNGEEEVRLTFNSVRTLSDLAGKVAPSIEADSASLAMAFADPGIAAKYGFTSETFKAMFLPDTYSLEWDTDTKGFLERMATEFKKFWTPERIQAKNALSLSQSEVSTLASIVQAEQQSIPAERPIIAGLYINRLKRGMRLQSDPTVIYALDDFSINRVLTKHLSFDSPYNTYLYAGLPPGPINIPSKQSIDAVLNAEEHRYIYMCAKADFSGYHAFATNLSQHNRNARAFQTALNQRRIYR